MKILIVNKFLFPNGGSETYIFKLGEQLKKQGHEVQFFGMEHPDRIVGNAVQSYVSNIDFHASGWQKIKYPFKIIYSVEARKKIKPVLEDFQPDVVHLNNINYQITPSVIYEIRKAAAKLKRHIPIVYTAHDYQWVCPNHMMLIPATGAVCFRCEGGRYTSCIKNKCIHNSFLKSLIGALESMLYHKLKTYGKVDSIICPSRFMQNKLATDQVLADKLRIMYNFIDNTSYPGAVKKDYVIYFGRYSEEKGVRTLLQVCGSLKDIPFIFAGSGALESEIGAYENVTNVGFTAGQELQRLIAEARVSVFPSECFENCPFAVMESQFYGTPVIAADIGGVPELLEDGITGELFQPGNAEDLKSRILRLWNDADELNRYTENCRNVQSSTVAEYCDRLLELYRNLCHTMA